MSKHFRKNGIAPIISLLVVGILVGITAIAAIIQTTKLTQRQTTSSKAETIRYKCHLTVYDKYNCTGNITWQGDLCSNANKTGQCSGVAPSGTGTKYDSCVRDDTCGQTITNTPTPPPSGTQTCYDCNSQNVCSSVATIGLNDICSNHGWYNYGCNSLCPVAGAPTSTPTPTPTSLCGCDSAGGFRLCSPSCGGGRANKACGSYPNPDGFCQGTFNPTATPTPASCSCGRAGAFSICTAGCGARTGANCTTGGDVFCQTGVVPTATPQPCSCGNAGAFSLCTSGCGSRTGANCTTGGDFFCQTGVVPTATPQPCYCGQAGAFTLCTSGCGSNSNKSCQSDAYCLGGITSTPIPTSGAQSSCGTWQGDQCSGNSCGTGNTCINNHPSSACVCKSTTDACGTWQSDQCSGNSCGANATCVNNHPTSACKCVANTPDVCGKWQSDQCSGTSCGTGNTCVNQHPSAACVCKTNQITSTPTPPVGDSCSSATDRPSGCSCNQSTQCSTGFCNTNAGYPGVCEIEGNPPCLGRSKCESGKCVTADRNTRPQCGGNPYACNPSDPSVCGPDYCCSDGCFSDSDCQNTFKPSSVIINGSSVVDLKPGTGAGRPGAWEEYTVTKNQSGGVVNCNIPTYTGLCKVYPYAPFNQNDCFNNPTCTGTVAFYASSSGGGGSCTITTSCNNKTITYTKNVTVRKTYPSSTPKPTRKPSPTGGSCTVSNGDANKDGRVDLIDFEIWKREFTAQLTTKTADFNCDGKVDLIDFAIWKQYKQ